MLEMRGAGGDETARQEVLRQFSTPQMRQQLLQELLQTELFARRARELKLDRAEAFVRAREEMEQSLLAGRLLNHEFEKIQPTDVDLEAYYKANREQYKEPESIDALVVELGEDDDPAALLQEVKAADDFRKLAVGRRSSEDASAKPQTHRIVRGQPDWMLGDTSKLFELSQGDWTKEPHVHKDKRFLVLVETKTEERTPPYAEVRPRVLNEYVTRKQRELSEQLVRDLMTRYDVRIVPPPEETKDGPDDKGEEERP
jgi:hypothetical protein